MRRSLKSLIGIALAIAAAGCGGGGTKTTSSPPSQRVAAIRVTSPAFTPGGRLPRYATCDGSGHPPPLNVARLPAGTKAVALVMHDPDAPGSDFTHWTVYDAHPGSVLSSGIEGRNSFGKNGYGAACPPKGDPPHHYVFDVYALKQKTALPAGAAPDQVRAAVARLGIGRGELVATYGR